MFSGVQFDAKLKQKKKQSSELVAHQKAEIEDNDKDWSAMERFWEANENVWQEISYYPCILESSNQGELINTYRFVASRIGAKQEL